MLKTLLGEFSCRNAKTVRNNITVELMEMLGWTLDGNGSGSYPEVVFMLSVLFF